MSTFTLEERYRLWNDGCSVRVEIGDDPDGLEMTEIVYVDENGERGTPINFTDAELPLLIKALQRRLTRTKENTCENPLKS